MPSTSNLFQIFLNSNLPTSKHQNYFAVYEHLLSDYRNKPITFVEIGVLDGGSLIMWRNYFGDSARIIGIDFNPNAKLFESEGFEIHIGDQQDPNFWREFFTKVGQVDVILDDGGHTYLQQQMTLVAGINHIADGGMLIIEDTHTSYMREFGYPSQNTFVNFATECVDSLYARFPNLRLANNTISKLVFSIEFFESIVSFKINRALCNSNLSLLNNSKMANSSSNSDYRYQAYPKPFLLIQKLYSYLVALRLRKRLGVLLVPLRDLCWIIFSIYTRHLNRDFQRNKNKFFGKVHY